MAIDVTPENFPKLFEHLRATDRRLCVVDLETTGLNVWTSKIVQIGILTIWPDGKVESWDTLVDPQCEIPAEAAAVNGLTRDKLAKAPVFDHVVFKVAEKLEGAWIIGFYSDDFDLPILQNEFDRSLSDFVIDKSLCLDAKRVEAVLEPRHLRSLHKKYYSQEHENQHDALADCHATLNVFGAQLELLPEDTTFETLIAKGARYKRMADPFELFYYDNEDFLCINFGKLRYQRVIENKGVCDSMQAQFGPTIRKLIKNEIKKHDIDTKL